MKQIIGSLILFLSLQAHSQTRAQKCISPADMKNFFNTYKVRAWSDDKNRWIDVTSVDPCDTKTTLYSAIKSTTYLDTILKTTATGANNSIVTKEGPTQYFQKRIGTFLLETTKHSSTCAVKGVMGYVANKGSNNTMSICPPPEDLSLLDNTIFLIHEARHVDGYPHVVCNHGLYKKVDLTHIGACDTNYEEQGSYGVEASFLTDLYRQTSNDTLKVTTRALLVQKLIQRFNQYPLDIKAGALVQSEDSHLSFFDGQKKVEPAVSFVPDAVISTVGVTQVMYYDTKARMAGITELNNKLNQANNLVTKAYYEHLSENEQHEVLDNVYGKDYSCFLLPRKLSCVVYPGDNLDIPINSFSPRNFLRTSNSSLVLSDMTYIVDQDGKQYAIGNDTKDLRRLKSDRDFKLSNLPAANLLSLALWDEGPNEIAVNAQGQLLMFSPLQKKWTRVAPYAGDKVKKAISPYYWSKKLEDL